MHAETQSFPDGKAFEEAELSGKKRRSIRNFLINKDVQGPIILLVVLVGFLCSLFNGVLYYFHVKTTYGIFRNLDVPEEFVDSRFTDLLDFGLILVLISTGITLVIACYSLVISHRSAGASYRIHSVIQEVIAGNLDARVHLRNKDAHQDMAQSFNEMMDGFKPNRQINEDAGGPAQN